MDSYRHTLLADFKVWVSLVGMVVGPVLAVALGYASARATAAAQTAQLETRMEYIEQRDAEQQRLVESFRDNYVLIREFRQHLDEQRETLKRIEDGQDRLLRRYRDR